MNKLCKIGKLSCKNIFLILFGAPVVICLFIKLLLRKIWLLRTKILPISYLEYFACLFSFCVKCSHTVDLLKRRIEITSI